MTSRRRWGTLLSKSEMPDLVNGLDALVSILTLGNYKTKYSGRLLSWAIDLYNYITRLSSDAGTRTRTAKEYFTLCRANALEGVWNRWKDFPPVPLGPRLANLERRKILHQISRTSRSLREADAELVSDSLEAHWKLASDEFETPAEMRESFRLFCKSRFGGRFVGTLKGIKPSSSFYRTKADGGALSDLKEITDAFRSRLISHLDVEDYIRLAKDVIPDSYPVFGENGREAFRLASSRRGVRSNGFLPKVRCDEVLFPYDKATEMSFEDWEVQREILFAALACREQIDFRELPKCRQVAVVERGFKCRVATPLEAPFRYLLGVINSGLLQSLERMPQVVSALHGRPAEKLDWTMGRRRNLVFSADLKSATDYFPQDLMESGVLGLTESWPPFWRRMFLRAVGPHELTSHCGSQVQVTRRGILMGSPVSWPLLSMYSAWLHHRSRSDGWFAVCGDDYLGCHTYSTYRRYCAERARTGAVGSPGKDLLTSCSVGVFAEELVTVGRCRWVPTVSIRAVLADSKAGQPSWSQGPEVAFALEVLKLNPHQEGAICRRLHKSMYSLLRGVGIDPVGPRWAGCGGFPGVPGHATLLRARRLVSQSPKLVIEWITKVEAAWSQLSTSPLLTMVVCEDVKDHFDTLAYVDPGMGSGVWGPLRDVVSSRLGSLSFSYYLAGAAMHLSRPSLSRVASVVKEFCQQVADRGRWLPQNSDVDRPGGLSELVSGMEPCCRPIPFRTFCLVFDFESPYYDLPPLRKRPHSGVGSPSWGIRKRVKLSINVAKPVGSRVGNQKGPE